MNGQKTEGFFERHCNTVKSPPYFSVHKVAFPLAQYNSGGKESIIHSKEKTLPSTTWKSYEYRGYFCQYCMPDLLYMTRSFKFCSFLLLPFVLLENIVECECLKLNIRQI